MIKDVEIAMVHAANYTMNYLDKKYNTNIDEIIKKFLNEFDHLYTKSELKIYSIAAINEAVKLKLKNKARLSNKQLMQMFTNRIPEIAMKIKEEEFE